MHKIFRLVFIGMSSILAACSQQATVPVSAPPTVDNEIRQTAIQQGTAIRSKQTERGVMLFLKDSIFEPETAEFAGNSDEFLDKIVDLLKQYPRRNAVIEVHTDNTGGERFNLKLSQRRAVAFRAALIQRGISPHRLLAKGYGETRPLGTNQSEVGRQQNRRIEISVLREGEILRF